ncbi:MAG: hypothetical protein NFW15_00955 [Candidatus Accumulibacter sp.]|nr:hypothetical protein [Accumulibacter sp.]MCM8610601.1 hypothetical protein [Accumulibacter sp.]MCM8634500.1 hypothetical protein [Accumulibacter sp.]MCM8641671.1 hypothetical protein [Accumulibacter sp.]
MMTDASDELRHLLLQGESPQVERQIGRQWRLVRRRDAGELGELTAPRPGASPDALVERRDDRLRTTMDPSPGQLRGVATKRRSPRRSRSRRKTAGRAVGTEWRLPFASRFALYSGESTAYNRGFFRAGV